MDRRALEWPFYGPEHRALSDDLVAWAPMALTAIDHSDTDGACRKLVTALGEAGFLRYCVPARFGGALPELDSRALCVARETLAYHDGLADFAFAMQGLGSGAITLAGDPDLQQEVLPRVVSQGCWAEPWYSRLHPTVRVPGAVLGIRSAFVLLLEAGGLIGHSILLGGDPFPFAWAI